MKQLDLGLKLSTKKTRKGKFLDEMDRVVPWAALAQIVEPHCPRAKAVRPPFAVETMLRIHYLQQRFFLSDPAVEEAQHDTPLFREVVEMAFSFRVSRGISSVAWVNRSGSTHGACAIDAMDKTANRRARQALRPHVGVPDISFVEYIGQSLKAKRIFPVGFRWSELDARAII